MRDPYLYDDIPVLKNKLGIRDQILLDNAEADYVVYRLKDLALNPLGGDYHTKHLLRMHEYIFRDLFEWAGVPRTISIYKEEDVLGGQSVEYSDPFDIINDVHHTLSDMRTKEWINMTRQQKTYEFCDSLARLWKIHPFRDGNKRIGVHAMLVFLALNDYEVEYTQKELSDLILDVAADRKQYEDILQWLLVHQI